MARLDDIPGFGIDRFAVAATPMRGWGGQVARRVRFVFSNEPVERLGLLGDRVRRALEAA